MRVLLRISVARLKRHKEAIMFGTKAWSTSHSAHWHQSNFSKPFISRKMDSVITPRSFREADLLIHLESDALIQSYRPTSLELLCSQSRGHEFDHAVCYCAEYAHGSYLFLMPSCSPADLDIGALEKLELALADQGYCFVLVDPSSLRREPQWTNIKHVLAYRDYEISLSDRMRIFDYVDAFGHAEIRDCAAVCRSSDDAIGCVLALIADRSLTVDMAQPLSLTSLVSRLDPWVQESPILHHQYNGTAARLAASRLADKGTR
jgi:hypothetical protein